MIGTKAAGQAWSSKSFCDFVVLIFVWPLRTAVFCLTVSIRITFTYKPLETMKADVSLPVHMAALMQYLVA